MPQAELLKSQFFQANSDYEALSTQLWHYQLQHNEVLSHFSQLLGTREQTFLPIEFFKQFALKTGNWQEACVFESSGTTGQTPSKHYIRDLDWYRQVSLQGFYHFFPKKQYKILALLPSYLERSTSSLVQMVRFWMAAFGAPGSGFYLHNFEDLAAAIHQNEGDDILLIGVAFALIDFADYFDSPLPPNTLVLETGGMKGRKKEWQRAELHAYLCQKFGLTHICSEYGMTELLSQAYALENGRFSTPPWLKVHISDLHLPAKAQAVGKAGRINLIDLANIDSCAFISTDDLGRLHEDGSFEVIGRIANSELRGCNLMYL